ncbi:response regulator [Bacillus sp. YZJH907-2]|uniref:Response regulator n=1 Tax=Halalkalibacter suaedae TaxID=2822140 RepID=A0A941APG6_9BACI|nr:response regulator [Bacillus suaedae]
MRRSYTVKKILVVDDQYGIRVLLCEILQKDGYQMHDAANGVQALKIVEKEQPDLVLLDMKIPGMDGLEILKHIKEDHPQINVIMMTAYGELNLINEAMSLGAITHFAKPFDIDDIRAVIKESIDGSKTEAK